MGDFKRVAVMEASTAGCMSKRRRILGSPEALFPSPSLSRIGDHRCLSLNLPENATTLSRLENSSGGAVAGEDSRSCFSEEQFPVSCSSSNECAKYAVKCKDLETKSFETVDSNCVTRKERESTPTSELHGDSDEMDSVETKFLTDKRKATTRPMKMPPSSEIEDFFAEAEKFEQKRFLEKYNFDIVMDVPLEGRYQWIRLKP